MVSEGGDFQTYLKVVQTNCESCFSEMKKQNLPEQTERLTEYAKSGPLPPPPHALTPCEKSNDSWGHKSLGFYANSQISCMSKKSLSICLQLKDYSNCSEHGVRFHTPRTLFYFDKNQSAPLSVWINKARVFISCCSSSLQSKYRPVGTRLWD